MLLDEALYSTANDPETANFFPKWTANDPRPQVIPKIAYDYSDPGGTLEKIKQPKTLI